MSERATSRTGARRRAAAPSWGLLALLTLVGAPLLCTACSSDRPRPIHVADDLHDPNPSIRAKAVSEAARLGHSDQIPVLIELLDDEDAVVRLTAGRALRDLTGRESGYRAYAPPEELRRQLEDWRTWWATQARSRRSGDGP